MTWKKKAAKADASLDYAALKRDIELLKKERVAPAIAEKAPNLPKDEGLPEPPKPPMPKDHGKKYDYFEPNKLKWLKKPFLGLMLYYAATIAAWFLDKGFVIKVFFIIFCIPFSILYGLALFVVLRYSGREIMGKIKTTISIERKFIIANFRMPNHRINRIFAYVDQTGQTFDYKEGTYGIDLECVWFDDFNYPNIDYVFGIPNPIRYDYEKSVTTWLKEHQENMQRAANGNTLVAYTSEAAFSAASLKMYKNQTFANAILKLLGQKNDGGVIPVMIVAGLALVAIVVIVIFMQHPTIGPAIAQNVTHIVSPSTQTVVVAG